MALGIDVFGYANRPARAAQAFSADNIVLVSIPFLISFHLILAEWPMQLTDALCSSTCSVFMEMMHHEAGVRTVVVGGQPKPGPMQAPSGARGAEFYSFADINFDIRVAEIMSTTAGDSLPKREEDMMISYAGINLRDQIRKNENVPLQFVYEAANCRIFFTPQTFHDFSKLWHYAADAIWSKPELCIKGSTGYTSGSDTTNTQGPPKDLTSYNPDLASGMSTIVKLSGATPDFEAGIIAGGQEHDNQQTPAGGAIGAACTKETGVSYSPECNGFVCGNSKLCGNFCFARCNNFQVQGRCYGLCVNKFNIGPGLDYQGNYVQRFSGYCIPSRFSCPSSTKDFQLQATQQANSGAGDQTKGGLGELINKGFEPW